MTTKREKLSILLLALIFILQFYFIFSKTTIGYVFDYKNNVEYNDIDYTLIEMSSDVIKEYINETDKNIIVLSKSTGGIYEVGIAYYYYSFDLLPLKKISDNVYSKAIEDLKPEQINDLTTKYDAYYFIIMGKDVSFYNIKTTNDINLYKITNKDNRELTSILSFDLSLYDLYNLDDDKEEFFDNVELLKLTISDYWDFNSIDKIRNFAIDLYDNGDYKLSKEYLEYYYNTVDTLNYEINFRLGDIEYKAKEYNNALKYYQSALNSENCDSDYIKNKIDEIKNNMGADY